MADAEDHEDAQAATARARCPAGCEASGHGDGAADALTGFPTIAGDVTGALNRPCNYAAILGGIFQSVPNASIA